MMTETNYSAMNRDQLASAYNEMAGTDLKATSYPKRTWLEMVMSMEDKPEETDEVAETKSRKPKVKDVVLELAMDPLLSNGRIAQIAAERVEGSQPTGKSVASIICLARQSGADVPKRQRPVKPKPAEYHPLAAEELLTAETVSD